MTTNTDGTNETPIGVGREMHAFRRKRIGLREFRVSSTAKFYLEPEF